MIYLINMLLVAAVVMIHYEVLRYMVVALPRMRIRPRWRVLVSIFGAFGAHIVEVWLFGLAYYLMDGRSRFGSLSGDSDGSLMSSVYFSFTTYSSLGIGDIYPQGDLRFLAGLEALTGLILIAWTASFIYLEMTRYWRRD